MPSFRATVRMLWGNRPFRLFWTASTVAMLGHQLSWVALAWFTLQQTDSSLAIGGVMGMYLVTSVVASPLAGYLFDRGMRKRLLILDHVARGLLYALIPLLHWTDFLSYPLLVVLLSLAGLLAPLSTVGSQSVLPNFVRADQLETANAFSQLSWQVAVLVGPAVGGAFTGLIGAPGTMLVNAALFILPAALLAAIPAKVYEGRQRERGRDRRRAEGVSFREGWRFFLATPPLVALTMASLLFNFAYGPLEPALPALVRDDWRAGPETLGLLWSALGIGTIVGTALWTRWPKRWAPAHTLGGVMAAWGVFTGGLYWIAHPVSGMALLFLAGLTVAPYNVVALTLEQRLVPPHLRGRVFGLTTSLEQVGLPLGMLVGGWMASTLGNRLTLLLAGVVCVAVGVAVMMSPWLKGGKDECGGDTRATKVLTKEWA
ncbi:MAG TPA: MFS transporter [Calditerricola sp.]